MRRWFKSKTTLTFGLPLLVSTATGLLVYWALFLAASKADEIAASRQTNLLHLIMRNMQSGIAHDQESVTVWDDAVIAVRRENIPWINANLGEWMHSYFGHDAALIYTGDGRLLYHYVAASAAAPSIEELHDGVNPMIGALRRRLSSGDDKEILRTGLSSGESDILNLNGRPAIVSAKPIVSDTGALPLRPGDEGVHVAVQFLDGKLAQKIGKQYLFGGLQFVGVAPLSKKSFIPVTSRSGATLCYIEWSAFAPGAIVVSGTWPVIVFLSACVFSVLSLCAQALWRRSASLALIRRQLEHLAMHDPLTGLANRARFDNAIKAKLSFAKPNQLHALFFIDLDHFKSVNDTYGHAVGDQLIIQASQRLVVRLPTSALACRMGGDEFTVLLEAEDEEQILSIAESIVTDLRQPYALADGKITIGASVGASSVRGLGESAELIRRADVALYNAKAAGRNAFIVFTEDMTYPGQARFSHQTH